MAASWASPFWELKWVEWVNAAGVRALCRAGCCPFGLASSRLSQHLRASCVATRAIGVLGMEGECSFPIPLPTARIAFILLHSVHGPGVSRTFLGRQVAP